MLLSKITMLSAASILSRTYVCQFSSLIVSISESADKFLASTRPAHGDQWEISIRDVKELLFDVHWKWTKGQNFAQQR